MLHFEFELAVRNEGYDFDNSRYVALTAIELKPGSWGEVVWDFKVVLENNAVSSGRNVYARDAVFDGRNLIVWLPDLREEWVVSLDSLPPLPSPKSTSDARASTRRRSE